MVKGSRDVFSVGQAVKTKFYLSVGRSKLHDLVHKNEELLSRYLLHGAWADERHRLCQYLAYWHS